MYHSTGFTKAEITELCARIEAREFSPGMRRWPPVLGLRNALTVTLKYMRRNRVQAEIAEDYAVSQPTISRAISAITPMLVNVLLEYVPTAGELGQGTCYIVDGTLLPCWSWRAHPELYSGKHKTTGMNVQLACTIDGHLAWISDPIPGSRHDNHCLGESAVLMTLDPCNWIGDKGYVGNNMITPFKKPAGSELLGWQKEFNIQVNKIRYVIEQVVANFKTWRIMHTGHRTGRRQLQDLADHAHRLPPPTGNIPRNHLSRSSPALLCNCLNNPQCSGNVSTTQQKAHKTPTAATAETPEIGLEITAAQCAPSWEFTMASLPGSPPRRALRSANPKCITMHARPTPKTSASAAYNARQVRQDLPQRLGGWCLSRVAVHPVS